MKLPLPGSGKGDKSREHDLKKSASRRLEHRSWNEFARYVFKEWVLTLGLAVVIAFLFRTTVASPRHIPTGSMIPTIKIGEFIFVNMMYYNWHIPFTRDIWKERREPQRGEIVVFEYPKDPDKDYIKRIVAVPGDVVEIRDKRVFINGEALPLVTETDRSLLEDLAPHYDPSRLSLYRETNGEHTYHVVHINTQRGRDLGPVAVPADSYFVMGDNRDDSEDSRYWGFVPRDKILGTSSFIWLSFDRHHPPFLRFDRFFTLLD